jgi:hypothetical protein
MGEFIEKFIDLLQIEDSDLFESRQRGSGFKLHT